MKNRIFNILATILLLGFLTIPARAEVEYAIGVAAHSGTFETTGQEKEGYNLINIQPIEENNSGVISEDVDFGAAFIEIVGRDGWQGMTVGLEYIPGTASMGAKTRTDSDGDTSDDADTGDYTGKAEVSDHITLYFEPTIYPTENFGIYGKLGVSHASGKSLENIDKGASSSTYGDFDLTGATYGFGLRAKVGLFMIKTDWYKTEYKEVSLESGTGNKNRITARPEHEGARIAIGLQF